MKPNNKNIHFFDLDGCLWSVDSKVWIVDKEEPDKPLLKLDKIDMNKILNGLYKGEDLKIEYNDEEYFISNDIYNKIRKKKNLPIERLGMSWIEYIDPKYINKNNPKFLLHNIQHLRGTDDLICIITGRSNRDRHAKILNQLRLTLKDYGLEIYKIYFVSDKFFMRQNETIAMNKANILIEHMVGLKTEDNKFAPLKQDWFSNIYFYDDELQNIDYANDVQLLLDRILKSTDDELFNIVTKRLKENQINLTTNLVTNNLTNLFKTNTVTLKEPTKYPIKLEKMYIKNFNKFLND